MDDKFMVIDVYWMVLNEENRQYLMGLCGDNRYRVIDPEELLLGMPECLQQRSFAHKVDSSLVVKRVATWPGGSSATVLMANIHRRDRNRHTGELEYDQQPFLLAHHSGESTTSASGLFINEGDWSDRTIRHWEGPGPLDALTRIRSSDINEYYPGSGVIHSTEGDIIDLYDTRYRYTLDATINLMQRE